MFFEHTRVRPRSKLKIAEGERPLGKQRWTRHGIRSIAHQLRMFFRYGEEMGWTKGGIAASIHGPRVYQHALKPASIQRSRRRGGCSRLTRFSSKVPHGNSRPSQCHPPGGFGSVSLRSISSWLLELPAFGLFLR